MTAAAQLDSCYAQLSVLLLMLLTLICPITNVQNLFWKMDVWVCLENHCVVPQCVLLPDAFAYS